VSAIPGVIVRVTIGCGRLAFVGWTPGCLGGRPYGRAMDAAAAGRLSTHPGVSAAALVRGGCGHDRPWTPVAVMDMGCAARCPQRTSPSGRPAASQQCGHSGNRGRPAGQRPRIADTSLKARPRGSAAPARIWGSAAWPGGKRKARHRGRQSLPAQFPNPSALTAGAGWRVTDQRRLGQ
jgi:hypothetical protein